MKIMRDWGFFLFFFSLPFFVFLRKANCQFRGSRCQIKHLFKFRLIKGVETFDRRVQGVVNYFFFFLIDWRNRRQNNTTMMVIMVQLLRRQGVGMGFVEWMTAFQQLGDQEREKTAAWGMWRFVWHMFPICSRLSIWGGILSMPTANCKLYLFNQIGKFKGEKKEDMPRHLGFHDPWWLSFWGILQSLWFLSHRRIPVDFIGKVVFVSLQRG